MPPTWSQAGQDDQRTKLANSYQSLLNEFSSKDLTNVGNYTVGKLIGKGSFGKVYLATHNLTNGSKVVLKSAKKDDANLAREIHHHRQFLHPHIARLYEVIVTENLVWLVLEYCAGDELYNHLLNHGPMDPAKVQKIFTQLVGAVSYVHAKSCVHRDLKLENILLDKHENVKLVDFGFTREYQGSTSYLQTWCGTVCYSAPEMIKGEKYAGEKVDVWSLGIILYALLCGELPFDDDDDSTTKTMILKEDPKYPEHLPQPAKDLMKKLLSKRPLLRPSLADILKDAWLTEHAPQQQEILKVQQPAPFTTQLEKDVLERMRSAGVDIDMVIENVLSQRCDALAGWWALLLEKEQRKERRRERKRKEREAEVRSIRRLSAASGRLLSLGEIHEGEEGGVPPSPRQRGRPLSRSTPLAKQPPDLPQVAEVKSPEPEERPKTASSPHRSDSHSGSRPPPPPKDYTSDPAPRSFIPSKNFSSRLQTVMTNSDLLSPQYVPPPQRKRPKFYPHPLKEQLAWVKGFFKDGTIRRPKSSTDAKNSLSNPTPNGHAGLSHGNLHELRRTSVGGPGGGASRRASVSSQANLPARIASQQRPRINTASSSGSIPTVARIKRTSLSPATMQSQLSYRRSSVGLRGRKSTSSSVSSIRTTYQSGHQHTHSKASSTSSNSVASPGGLSSTTSTSRIARSPHSSVKLLPSTPTSSSFPSGIKFTRRAVPTELGLPPSFNNDRSTSAFIAPLSPGLPVFARRKRSVFKGPLSGSSGSPSGFGRNSTTTRAGSIPRGSGRTSTELMPGLVEEEDEEVPVVEIGVDEELDDEDGLYEEIEIDQFGREVVIGGNADTDTGGRVTAATTPADETPSTPLKDISIPLPILHTDTASVVASEDMSPLTPMPSATPVREIIDAGSRPTTATAAVTPGVSRPATSTGTTKLTAAALAEHEAAEEKQKKSLRQEEEHDDATIAARTAIAAASVAPPSPSPATGDGAGAGIGVNADEDSGVRTPSFHSATATAAVPMTTNPAVVAAVAAVSASEMKKADGDA